MLNLASEEGMFSRIWYLLSIWQLYRDMQDKVDAGEGSMGGAEPKAVFSPAGEGKRFHSPVLLSGGRAS